MGTAISLSCGMLPQSLLDSDSVRVRVLYRIRVLRQAKYSTTKYFSVNITPGRVLEIFLFVQLFDTRYLPAVQCETAFNKPWKNTYICVGVVR